MGVNAFGVCNDTTMQKPHAHKKTSMGDKTFKDDDESVYKDYILYVVPQSVKSQNLVRFMQEHRGALFQKTWIQNALLLPRRPAWLNGVPILVDKDNKRAYKGSYALQFVQQFKDDEPMFAGAVAGNYFGFNEGESVSAFASSTARADTPWDEETEDSVFDIPGNAPFMGSQMQPHGYGPQPAAQRRQQHGGAQRSRRDVGMHRTQSAAEAFLAQREALDHRLYTSRRGHRRHYR